MLRDFLVEAKEQVELLDQELVRLESEPESAEALAVVFRVMHTLKGGAGFLCLQRIENLAHCAETVLAKIRDEGLVVNRSRIDVLLEAADLLRAIVENIEHSGVEGELCCEGVCARLKSTLEDEAQQVDSELAELEALQEQLMESLGKAHPEPPPPEKASLDRVSSEEAPDESRGPASCPDLVRVRVDLLDKLMNLVGELVLSRNQILQLTGVSEDGSLNSACQRIDLVTSELQEHIMQTRMQPVGNVLKRFPRLVRDMAAQTGKEVRLVVDGQDTGLDRTVIEAIKDPLTHILRNSIDHGIETPAQRIEARKPAFGTIHVRAYHEGGQVTIEFKDDGGGIDSGRVKCRAIENGLVTHAEAEAMSDRDLLQLIFEPGFSTAKQVTSLSGRGVGMDVVRTSTETIGGTVDLQSVAGKGTTVKLRIPLTLAIIPALIVNMAEERYAIPQVNLQELVRLENDESIESLYGAEVYRLRGKLLPLMRLRDVLGLPRLEDSQELNIVVLNFDSLTFGLLVDGVCDTEEIVVKPLGSELKRLQVYAGATIMGDGRIALILDVGGLARCQDLRFEELDCRQNEASQNRRTANTQAMLLLSLGGEASYSIPLNLVSRLEEFPSAKVEQLSGQSVIQYRDDLLPLFSLAELMGVGGAPSADTLQVLVFESAGHALGLTVDRILDVVEQEFALSAVSGAGYGTLGSSIIDGKAVSIIDLESVLGQVQPGLLSSEGGTVGPWFRVLLVGPDSLRSRMARSNLELEGHAVTAAETAEEALQRIAGQEFDCLLLTLPAEEAAHLRTKLGELEAGLPLLALSPGINGIEFLQDVSRSSLLDSLQRMCREVAA